MSNPKCPLDGGNTVRLASLGVLKCSVCYREYDTKTNLVMYRACLDEMDKIVSRAAKAGLNPAKLLTDLAARHLMSDFQDPAHMDGIEFAKLFEAAMRERDGEVPL